MLNNAHDAATNRGAAITSNRVSITLNPLCEYLKTKYITILIIVYSYHFLYCKFLEIKQFVFKIEFSVNIYIFSIIYFNFKIYSNNNLEFSLLIFIKI